MTGRVQGVLATQAALYTVGVGAGAVPISAAVQWVLKDGVGHAAAIGYGTAINTRFDADAKRYRFQSTCALTVADIIACSMPFYPQHFFVMASAASAMSTTANVAQTASRARIMASFARRGNLADCVRCGQAHAKLMSLVGTGIGAAIGGYIGPEPYTLLALLVPLASTSLFSIHRASKLVVLRSLNVQRAERAFVVLIDQLLPPPPAGSAAVVTPPEGEALAARLTTLAADAPEAVAEREEFAVRYDRSCRGRCSSSRSSKAKPPDVWEVRRPPSYRPAARRGARRGRLTGWQRTSAPPGHAIVVRARAPAAAPRAARRRSRRGTRSARRARRSCRPSGTRACCATNCAASATTPTVAAAAPRRFRAPRGRRARRAPRRGLGRSRCTSTATAASSSAAAAVT